MAAVPVVGRWSVVLATLALLLSGCSDPRTTEPDASEPVAAKAPTGPSVSSAVPDNAPQDTTLDVQVVGSGFDQGSRVDLALAGVLDSFNVHTNSTRFISSTSLIANITISRTATFARYDVVVQTSKGKKGIGTELFLVRAVNDIGTLGGCCATARGVNAAGMIVGAASDATGYAQAFAWTESEGMRSLPRLPTSTSASAYAANSAQVIVGSSGTDGPVRWVPTGPGTWAVQALGYFGGSVHGIAFAVNDSGVIVGYSDDSASIARPFLWTETGGMVALPVPPGAADGQARGINGSGTVVGFYHPTGVTQRAAAWPASGGVVELPFCSGGTGSTAYAINDGGVVVGDCTVPGKRGTGGTFAARWLPDPARPDAWLAPELICAGGRAQGVNNAGDIVGYGCGGPFYWDEVQGLRALEILPRAANGQGALGINDPAPGGTFRIVGNLNTSSGQGHAVWWPRP
jgi:probable HAF family extracellular repeat protein